VRDKVISAAENSKKPGFERKNQLKLWIGTVASELFFELLP
jgi:hypothetical protein